MALPSGANGMRADPEVFRRRAKEMNTAAALGYLVARANRLIGPDAAIRAGAISPVRS